MNIKLKASWNFQHISKVVYPDHLKIKIIIFKSNTCSHVMSPSKFLLQICIVFFVVFQYLCKDWKILKCGEPWLSWRHSKCIITKSLFTQLTHVLWRNMLPSSFRLKEYILQKFLENRSLSDSSFILSFDRSLICIIIYWTKCWSLFRCRNG